MECDICGNKMCLIKKPEEDSYWLCDKCDFEVRDFGVGYPFEEDSNQESEEPPVHSRHALRGLSKTSAF